MWHNLPEEVRSALVAISNFTDKRVLRSHCRRFAIPFANSEPADITMARIADRVRKRLVSNYTNPEIWRLAAQELSELRR